MAVLYSVRWIFNNYESILSSGYFQFPAIRHNAVINYCASISDHSILISIICSGVTNQNFKTFNKYCPNVLNSFSVLKTKKNFLNLINAIYIYNYNFICLQFFKLVISIPISFNIVIPLIGIYTTYMLHKCEKIFTGMAAEAVGMARRKVYRKGKTPLTLYIPILFEKITVRMDYFINSNIKKLYFQDFPGSPVV